MENLDLRKVIILRNTNPRKDSMGAHYACDKDNDNFSSDGNIKEIFRSHQALFAQKRPENLFYNVCSKL